MKNKQKVVEERQVVEREYKLFGEYDYPDLERMNTQVKESIEELVLPEFQKEAKMTVKKYHYYGDSEPSIGLFLIYKDYENEEEKNKREGYEERVRKMQEERDKAEFKRLSQKFAGK